MITQILRLPFMRMPSKALIDALGWDVIEEIDKYVEYSLRDELSRATQRLRREIQDLKHEIRRLQPGPPSGEELKS